MFAGYQNRMRATDSMLAQLVRTIEPLDRPVVLCAFGDHLPILPEVYDAWGLPNDTTDYVIWCNDSHMGRHGDPGTDLPRRDGRPEQTNALACHALAAQVMAAAGIGGYRHED